MPEHVTQERLSPLTASLPNLANTERLDVEMEYGITSRVYYLRATASAGCLMVYHEGHRVSVFERKWLLGRILERGCDALAVSMPLTSINNRPTIAHPRFGLLPLTHPDKLELLETEGFSTTHLFLTPVVVALNHALAAHPVQRVGMMGFSGGGWVTMLAAALDSRIQASYIISGTVPMAVHAGQLGWGDYKQRLARLYDIANYPELYVMGATEPARRQVHGMITHDPCCFAGRNSDHYLPPVARRAAQFGGRVVAVTDENASEHAPPAEMVRRMLQDFNGGESAATP